jgi:PAS domain S-box-containing protein
MTDSKGRPGAALRIKEDLDLGADLRARARKEDLDLGAGPCSAHTDLLWAERALADLGAGPDDVTAVIDARGRLLSVSSNCQQLLGYDAEELVGTRGHALLHPDDFGSMGPALRAFAEGLADHIHSIQRMRHKTNGYRLVETTVRSSSIPGTDGPSNAVVVAKAPEAPRHPVAAPMVSFAPAAIGTAYAWVIEGSSRGVVASADPVFAALLRSTTAALVGRPLEELTDPCAPAVGRGRLEALLDGSSATYQVERAATRPEATIELTVSLLPLPDRPGRTAVIQARDVTRQREAARVARDSLSELQRSNRELEAFASVAAHDLAAPLKVVVGYAETLARGDTEVNPQMAELLNKVASTSRRMQAQVDGLMMLARTDGEELRTGNHDVGALVQEALEPMRSEIQARLASVDVGVLPVMECNATGIVLVFGNLISNALKYARECPSVTVRAVRESGGWRFTVADRGVGLPEGNADQLFELFERGAGAAPLPGAGIGLAVCRRIVERHGGRIWCSRRPGGGAAFHFTVPANTSEGDVGA